MWPMHMHMEERRAQLPAELAGAQLMTGSTSNFQEMEAEQAEEQQEEEAGPAQVYPAPAKPHPTCLYPPVPMFPSPTDIAADSCVCAVLPQRKPILRCSDEIGHEAAE
jgi:hypothetical protein